jgi:hypothetical protein
VVDLIQIGRLNRVRESRVGSAIATPVRKARIRSVSKSKIRVVVGIRPTELRSQPQNGDFMAESQKSPAAESPRPDPNEKLVKIFDAERESEVLVVKGLLESSGIDCDVTALSAPQDTFPGVGGTIILVREEDAEAARRIIAEFRQSPDADDDETAEYDAVDDEAVADSTGEPPQKG